MKCITSPALDDTQIVSYIEGEADDGVVAHIRECLFCSERANQWSLLQNRLRKQLYRITCPTPMELGDYHLGLLPDPQKLIVAQHVRECPSCRREIAILEDFLAEPLIEASLVGKAKMLIARLVGGNTGDPAPGFAALRGEARGPLTFEADGVVITLDVQTDVNGQASILGQLAADDQDQWTGARLELQRADLPQLTASLDDLGAFRFEDVHPGAIQITIRSLYGIQVQIPNINIVL
jgi:hypothetical protein